MTADIVPPDDQVDAVVTWVDNADTRWQAKFNEHCDASRWSEQSHRYREWGTLKYCLRSIHKNMPWLENIYLVTDDQAPDWLRTDYSRIRIVDHTDVFEDSDHLPTFNSMAIESHMHRIRGLSRRFLYLNDDVVVLKPVRQDRFFTVDGGHVLPREDTPLPGDLRTGHTTDRSLAYTGLTLTARFGPRERFLTPHTPQPYDRRWISQLWTDWRHQLQRTSMQRLRATDCIALRTLYYNTIRELPVDEWPDFAKGSTYRDYTPGDDEYSFLTTREDLSGFKEQIRLNSARLPDMICINDETANEGDAIQKSEVLILWLETLLPERAPWER